MRSRKNKCNVSKKEETLDLFPLTWQRTNVEYYLSGCIFGFILFHSFPEVYNIQSSAYKLIFKFLVTYNIIDVKNK